MPQYEVYRARADARAAAAQNAERPFSITIRFLGGLTEGQRAAFRSAADRWTRVIVGDLPPVVVDGETIDDVLILAEGAPIDGVGEILGQAGPTHLRPRDAGVAAFLPAKGQMQFDSADLAEMEASGALDDVITHEMGHVLGIGTVWSFKELLAGALTQNPTFVGDAAMLEYAALRGLPGSSLPVPVENSGGIGTRDSHWRESIFQNELMSGFIAATGNPLSRVTVASLADLGYLVDLDAAEPFTLPSLIELAERGLLVARERAPYDTGSVLPLLPTVLPGDSLIGA
jgi:hypothetical protein